MGKKNKLPPEDPLVFRDFNNDSIELSIDGLPIGKGRPKVTSRFGHAFAYTPTRTKDYEQKIKMTYINNYTYFHRLDGPLEATINQYFPVPKGTSKVKHQKMINNEIQHTKKPDIDNIIKSILDGLNGLAYEDDSQIVSLTANKYYSDNPRVDVSIKKINRGEL